ncbi:MAG TPA: hypothetical protein VF468_20660 [Actinomycetota bacterium]|jgi:hypothetical protein|nr:hypothetical protein [Actinomycetes bacterium]HEX5880703.1 hypothetical protein [Actinomycetota bacterium]
MGRGPNWHPPRHLASVRRSRTDAREHLVAEWLLAAVAIVLTIAVLVGQMLGRPGAPAPDPPAAAPPPETTRPPAAWTSVGGARVERTVPAGFTPTGPGNQGMAAAGMAGCTPGRVYAATLRVRASQPGTLVQVTLLEVAGGRRFAADTIGALLPDRGWRRVEVAHEAQRPGTALAVEVVLPRGSPRATVMVDDLRVEASATHRIRSG